MQALDPRGGLPAPAGDPELLRQAAAVLAAAARDADVVRAQVTDSIRTALQPWTGAGAGAFAAVGAAVVGGLAALAREQLVAGTALARYTGVLELAQARARRWTADLETTQGLGRAAGSIGSAGAATGTAAAAAQDAMLREVTATATRETAAACEDARLGAYEAAQAFDAVSQALRGLSLKSIDNALGGPGALVEVLSMGEVASHVPGRLRAYRASPGAGADAGVAPDEAGEVGSTVGTAGEEAGRFTRVVEGLSRAGSAFGIGTAVVTLADGHASGRDKVATVTELAGTATTSIAGGEGVVAGLVAVNGLDWVPVLGEVVGGASGLFLAGEWAYQNRQEIDAAGRAVGSAVLRLDEEELDLGVRATDGAVHALEDGVHGQEVALAQGGAEVGDAVHDAAAGGAAVVGAGAGAVRSVGGWLSHL